MHLYAITDRRLYPGDERQRCSALLQQAAAWAQAGVDYIQLREKDLSAPALQALAVRLVEVTRRDASPTRILINGPAAVAQNAGADGLHLPSGFVSPQIPSGLITSAACHTQAEVSLARASRAALLLFAPVFEKPLWTTPAVSAHPTSTLAGVGLTALSQACDAAGPVPVYALGGVTPENAPACLEAGAAGVAGIRLFAGEDWRLLVGR